jgi:hypothetical protein
MSRSYRRPYAAVTGVRSAKQDKILAHRGERRAHRDALRTAVDFEDFLLPHRLECAWNEVYSWGRDGHQRYQKHPRFWRMTASVQRWYSPAKFEKWLEQRIREHQRVFRK